MNNSTLHIRKGDGSRERERGGSGWIVVLLADPSISRTDRE
jgi:hypothetical protein